MASSFMKSKAPAVLSPKPDHFSGAQRGDGFCLSVPVGTDAGTASTTNNWGDWHLHPSIPTAATAAGGMIGTHSTKERDMNERPRKGKSGEHRRTSTSTAFPQNSARTAATQMNMRGQRKTTSSTKVQQPLIAPFSVSAAAAWPQPWAGAAAGAGAGAGPYRAQPLPQPQPAFNAFPFTQTAFIPASASIQTFPGAVPGFSERGPFNICAASPSAFRTPRNPFDFGPSSAFPKTLVESFGKIKKRQEEQDHMKALVRKAMESIDRKNGYYSRGCLFALPLEVIEQIMGAVGVDSIARFDVAAIGSTAYRAKWRTVLQRCQDSVFPLQVYTSCASLRWVLSRQIADTAQQQQHHCYKFQLLAHDKSLKGENKHRAISSQTLSPIAGYASALQLMSPADSFCHACQLGEESIVDALLIGNNATYESSGADKTFDVNAKNSAGETALHSVVRAATGPEEGSAARAHNISEKPPQSPHLYQSQTNIIRRLVRGGANINAKDNQGNTPLWYAAVMNRLELVEELLALGANCNENSYGHTPIYSAVSAGLSHMNVIKVLLDAPAIDLNIEVSSKPTKHCGAGLFGYFPPLPSCLHIAAAYNNIDLLEAVLAAGADISAADDTGSTALHVAAQQGLDDAARIILLHRMKTTPIATGADIDDQDRDVANSVNDMGMSPLHYACNTGSLQVAQQLIQAGADININCDAVLTPLCCAIANDHYEIARLLLKAGALVNMGHFLEWAKKTQLEDLAALAANAAAAATTSAAAAAAAAIAVDGEEKASGDLQGLLQPTEEAQSSVKVFVSLTAGYSISVRSFERSFPLNAPIGAAIEALKSFLDEQHLPRSDALTDIVLTANCSKTIGIDFSLSDTMSSLPSLHLTCRLAKASDTPVRGRLATILSLWRRNKEISDMSERECPITLCAPGFAVPRTMTPRSAGLTNIIESNRYFKSQDASWESVLLYGYVLPTGLHSWRFINAACLVESISMANNRCLVTNRQLTADSVAAIVAANDACARTHFSHEFEIPEVLVSFND